MIKTTIKRIAVALLGSASLAATTHAGGPSDVVSASIREGWMTNNGTRMAALHLKLAPGWKTYWRAPGDAGIPPTFNWKGSKNLKAVSYHWPSPEVFTTYGMRSVGYSDELVLPIELHPTVSGEPIVLKGRMDLGVCETVCMPANLTVSAKLQGLGNSDPEIRQALAQRPVPGARAGVSSVECEITPISDGLSLSAEIRMPQLSGQEIAVVEAGDPRIWVSDPVVQRAGKTLHVQADMMPPYGTPVALDRSALRFTVIGASKAVDIRGCGKS